MSVSWSRGSAMPTIFSPRSDSSAPMPWRTRTLGAHLLHTLDKVRDALTDPRHKALLGAERGRVERAMEQKEN